MTDTTNTDLDVSNDNDDEETTDFEENLEGQGGDDESFKIFVNDELVWESEGNAMLVDRVSVYRAAGEATAIGSPGTDQWLRIQVNERSYDAPETYLDIIEDRQRRERREQFEPGTSGSEREGYVQADPETGQPMGQDDNNEDENNNNNEVASPTTQEEQDQQKEASSDLEF